MTSVYIVFSLLHFVLKNLNLIMYVFFAICWRIVIFYNEDFNGRAMYITFLWLNSLFMHVM